VSVAPIIEPNTTGEVAQGFQHRLLPKHWTPYNNSFGVSSYFGLFPAMIVNDA
jgi:hypothetical protein